MEMDLKRRNKSEMYVKLATSPYFLHVTVVMVYVCICFIIKKLQIIVFLTCREYKYVSLCRFVLNIRFYCVVVVIEAWLRFWIILKHNFLTAMNNHSSFSHWEWFLPEKLFTTQSPLHLIYEFVFVHSYMVYIWLSQYNRFHNPFPLKSACLSTLSLSYCSPIMTPTLFLWLPKPVFMMVLWVINIWQIIYVRVVMYVFFFQRNHANEQFSKWLGSLLHFMFFFFFLNKMS